MTYQSIVPYTCVFIDAHWKNLLHAARQCVAPTEGRKKLLRDLQAMWMTERNPNPVLPCLSVRTGLDLYLCIKQFPPGSEIIMSAINIPDIAIIVHHHGLRIVSLDVELETAAPKVELLESLISDKTVCILLAHIYGKWFDLDPFVRIAKNHNVPILEDCAEGFSGFQNLGHPESEISFFSFGVIKFYTAFGGAILKVKDRTLYDKLQTSYSSYDSQSSMDYLEKIMKYSVVYLLMNCPRITKPGMYIARSIGLDHQALVMKMLRGFPENLIGRIRRQPSTPLLYMMHKRMSDFLPADYNLSRIKGEYVSDRLSDSVTQIGVKVDVNNFWLFPVIVDNPDSFTETLNSMGIDAYRGATQLNIIEPDNGGEDMHTKHLKSAATMYKYPHEAKFIIDHIVYLPVNKNVPFHELDTICTAISKVLKLESRAGATLNANVKSKL